MCEVRTLGGSSAFGESPIATCEEMLSKTPDSGFSPRCAVVRIEGLAPAVVVQ
jgi:hypothetical protein